MTKQSPKPLNGMLQILQCPINIKSLVSGIQLKITRHANNKNIRSISMEKKHAHPTEIVLEITDRKVLAYENIKSAIIYSLYVQNEGENMSMMGEVEDVKVFRQLLYSDLTCKVLRSQNFFLSNSKKS